MAKRILITGANSYIGTSFEKWLERYPGQYEADTIDMIDGSWREKSFAGYDVVFHVAGIAHIDIDKKTNEAKDNYYKVNCDLAVETAKKAKTDGVKQYVFLSSIAVYGTKHNIISKDTMPQPENIYGKSKLKAEEGIMVLDSSSFRVVIIRPPMVYGIGCKGNYPRLSQAAKKLPVFPDIKNKRSMIYIKNLCELVRLLIDNEDAGVFCPQNEEYVCTGELVKLISELHGKKIKLLKDFNWIVNISKYISKRLYKIISKVFGDLIYEKKLSEYKSNYRVYDFASSIKETESRL